MTSRSFLPLLSAGAAALVLAVLVIVPVAQDPAPPEQQAEAVTNEESVSLFDGETLAGWEGDTRFWRVEDGAITGEITAESPLTDDSFLRWSEGEVDDFELTVECRIFSGKSGIQVRGFGLDQPGAVGGIRADIDATIIEAGEWKTYRIVAQGNKIVSEINGTAMSGIIGEDEEVRRRAGLLALRLCEGAPVKVQFRNIKIKRLPLGDVKKIVYLAGAPSHPPRMHEHNAGALLAQKLLNTHHGDKVLVTTYLNGWPSDKSAFQNADALVIQSDGGPKHPAYWHLRQIDYLREKGIGVGMLHYAVEMTPGETNDTLIAATGGAFEIHYSVNPHWDGAFEKLPAHPVASGVRPFTIRDEWYFNMRFIKDMAGVTPILSAVAPDETMSRPDGHHSGNPAVRKMVAEKQSQHVCWVVERPEGGRGFGFTGLHFHDNWAQDDFRKTILNAICWIAKVEIPEGGIETPTPTQEELDANLDPKPQPKPKPKA